MSSLHEEYVGGHFALANTARKILDAGSNGSQFTRMCINLLEVMMHAKVQVNHFTHVISH